MNQLQVEKNNKSIITRHSVVMLLVMVLLCFTACLPGKGKKEVEKNQADDIYKPKHTVFFEIQSLSNKKNNNYDMVIIIDDKEIGTVPSGALFTQKEILTEGDHELTLVKLGRNSLKTSEIISVSKDMTYCCDVKHKGASIKIKNITTQDGISDSEEITVCDVNDLMLSNAMNDLHAAGFQNIKVNSDEEITDETAWVVKEQSLSPDSSVDRRIPIVLDCISLDEYLVLKYKGKSVLELGEIEERNNFVFDFVKYPGEKAINNRVKSDVDNNRDVWKIIGANRKSGNNIILSVSYGNLDENPYHEILTMSEKHNYNTIQVGDTATVTLTASPSGLSEEDFYCFTSNTYISYSIKEINSDDAKNQTKMIVEILGKKQGDSSLTIKSNYDMYDSFDDELSLSIPIKILPKQKEEKPKEIKQPNEEKPRVDNTPKVEPEIPVVANVEPIPQPQEEVVTNVEPIPQPQQEVVAPSGGGGVYINEYGTKYHYSASCAGSTAWETSLADAISRGKGPCSKCVH